MKGGFYNPPNDHERLCVVPHPRASMKGGFYNPPNTLQFPLHIHYQLLQ